MKNGNTEKTARFDLSEQSVTTLVFTVKMWESRLRLEHKLPVQFKIAILKHLQVIKNSL